VIRHAWKTCEEKFKTRFDIVVDLDVTSPIRSVADLDNCLKIFLEKKAEILFSVVEAKKNPYFNMVEEAGNGFVKISKDLPAGMLRRQDAPKVYDMNASIYFYNREFLADENNNRVTASKRATIYVMSDISSVDIDCEADYKYIEYLIKEGVVKL
jgi:CMP-N-acetylneuraminic acid synthetase